MSLLTRIARSFGYERRSSLENPQTPLSYPAEWLLDIFNMAARTPVFALVR